MKKAIALVLLFLSFSCTTDERLDEIETIQEQIEELLASLENSDIDTEAAEAALEALQAQLGELQTEIESEIEESEDAEDAEDAEDGKYGLTIGDEFYPMSEGAFSVEDKWPDYKFGDGEDCDNISELENDHLIYLELYENSLRITDESYSLIGSGKALEIYIWTNASDIKDGEYENISNLINDLYGTNFVLNSDGADEIYEEESQYEELWDVCFSWSGYIESISYNTIENGVYSDEEGPGFYEMVTLNDAGEFTFKRKRNDVSITFEGFSETSNSPVSLNFKGVISDLGLDQGTPSKSMKRRSRNSGLK